MMCGCCKPAQDRTIIREPLPRVIVAIEKIDEGSSLGIDVDESAEHPAALLIIHVSPDGPIAAFNSQSEDQVLPGDWIEKVNHTSGDPAEIEKVLRTETDLHIEVLKSWAPPEFKRSVKKKKKAPIPEKAEAATATTQTERTTEEQAGAQTDAPTGPNFSGEWILEEVTGDAERMFRAMGLSWAVRRGLKNARWGAGVVENKVEMDDEKYIQTGIKPTQDVNTVLLGKGPCELRDTKSGETAAWWTMDLDGEKNCMWAEVKIQALAKTFHYKYTLSEDGDRRYVGILDENRQVYATSVFRRK